MNEKEKQFRAKLKKEEKEYYEKRDKQNNDPKKMEPFINEMKNVEIVGDELEWLN